jgi:ABC-type multidrug transport system, ATPase component
MYSLTTTQLTKAYSRTLAVDAATIALRPGRIYGLLGPNGSGKTTLMKMAAGLAHPTAGQIRVLDRPVSAETRAQIAYMPTEPYFYGFMTVKQVGAFHADFYADFSTEAYEKLIEKMGLAMSMKVSQLSSGMAAKLKVTAAAARDAKLIMFDEPLNGIDLIARDAILAAIIERANENNTILISSHLIDVMESILDEVIFIRQGRVVLQGETEAVRAQHGKSIVDLYREVFAS